MTDSQLKTARQLYHPSDEAVEMVANICALLDSTLMIGDLQVKWIERENSHCVLLVHWYPNRNLSLRDDPLCSAFVLTDEELKTLYEAVMKAA